MSSGTSNDQNPLNQQSGLVDLSGLYKPQPIDVRKEALLKHNIFMDKLLFFFFILLMIAGFLIVKYEQNTTSKTIGSGMVGAAIGALANRMKDGKLSPD